MKLPLNQGLCLDALLRLEEASFFGSESFFGFKPVAAETGLDVKEVRRKVRALKRKGLARFSAGLWNEDGQPAGSGYGLTQAGLELARARQNNSTNSTF